MWNLRGALSGDTPASQYGVLAGLRVKLDSMAVTASARRSIDGRLRGPRSWVGGLLGGR